MRLLVIASIVLACTVALSAQNNGGPSRRAAPSCATPCRRNGSTSFAPIPNSRPTSATPATTTAWAITRPEAIAKQVEHAKQQLKVFEAIDTSGFPDEEVLNQQLMVRDLREDVEGAKFNNWEMPVNQFWGVHLNYASMPTQMPFKTVQDYKNYIARLHQLPRVFDQVTEDMKLGLRDQLMPPKFLLEKVTVQAQEIADASEMKSPFMQPVLQFPEGFSPADQQRLRDDVRKTVKAEVNPAYAKFAAFVKNDYAPKGRTEMGVWSLPDGDARYQYEVRHMTTTSFQPEQIHQMGLKQVADLESQMLAIAKQQGFADLKSFNEHIRQDPKLHGTSGQQILDLYQHYTDQMYPKLPQLFGRLPKNKLVVVPMEAYRAPNCGPCRLLGGSRQRLTSRPHQRERVRSRAPPAAERGSHRLSRRHSRAPSAVFHCAGVDRHSSLPQVRRL